MTRTIVVAPGPEEHGVVRYARRSAGDARARFVEAPVGAAAPEALAAAVAPADVDVLHVHYTDQLFGRRSEDGPLVAGRLVERFDRPTVVTLHDVPGGDGDERDARRSAAYRIVAALADEVMVGSEHERERLFEAGVRRHIDVVPMSWEPVARAEDARPLAAVPVVGVLGFIFPGKGHLDVVAALRQLDTPVELWAIGRPSDGHDDLRDELVDAADRAGLTLRVTGFVDDTELASLALAVDVPVAAQHHGSASASLLTWIGARRRPVTRVTPFATEVAHRAAGALTLYDPADPTALTRAVRKALDDPRSTMLARRPAELSPARVGGLLAERYARLAERAS